MTARVLNNGDYRRSVMLTLEFYKDFEIIQELSVRLKMWSFSFAPC